MTVMSQAANQKFEEYGKLVKIDRLLDSVADRAYQHNQLVEPWLTGWETDDITVEYPATTLILVMYVPYKIAGGNDPLTWIELQYSQNSGTTWTKVSRTSFFGDFDSNNHDCIFHQVLIPNISAGTIRFRTAYAGLLSGAIPTITVNPTGGPSAALYMQYIAMQYATPSVTGSLMRKIAELPRGKETAWQEIGSTVGEVTFTGSTTITFPNMVKAVGTGFYAVLRIPAGMVTVLGPTSAPRMVNFAVEFSHDGGSSWTPYGTTAKYGTTGGVNDQMAKYRHTCIPVWRPASAGSPQVRFRVTITADTATTSGYQVNRGLTNSSPFRASVSLMEIQI